MAIRMTLGISDSRILEIAPREHLLLGKINRRRAIERPLGNLFEREKILYCRPEKNATY
jgi:hypothetical protein